MSRDFYCGVSVTYIFNITDIFLFFLIYRETQINQKSRRPWSEVDKQRVPGKVVCTQCITEENALGQMSWKAGKNWVH